MLRMLGIALLWTGLLLIPTGCNLYYDVDDLERPDAGPGNGGGGDVCDPESDEMLCEGSEVDCGPETFTDSCGDERTISCNTCDSGFECLAGICECASPSSAELCSEHHSEACGSLSITDRCDDERTVQCGGCDEDQFCDFDDNRCRDCEVDCDGLCGMVPDGCGGFVDCSASGGVTCEATESCVDFTCQDGDCPGLLESCDAGECGSRPDGCGGIVECDVICAENEVCQQNQCLCVPESDSQLCDDLPEVECGAILATDSCGDEREVECGTCPSGLFCTEDNLCGQDPSLCEGLDLSTNFEHCGVCGNACAIDEVCVDGECETLDCVADQGTLEGTCDPVTPSGCNFDTQRCGVRVENASDPWYFLTTCSTMQPGHALSTPKGESCSGTPDCEQELICLAFEASDPRGTVCMEPCFREDVTSCGADEVCVGQPDSEDVLGLGSVGFCAPTCSPFTPGSCGGGERCVADPGYPSRTCSARFRCMINNTPAGKVAGSPCDRNDLFSDGCPPELTCFPAGEDGADVCVRPCTGSCPGGGACVNGEYPWQAMRYCEF